MRSNLFRFFMPLAILVAATVSVPQLSAGVIVLEGSDINGVHLGGPGFTYTTQLLTGLKGGSPLPVLVLASPGTPLGAITGSGVPHVFTTSLGAAVPAFSPSNYSALYIMSPSGCCDDGRVLVTAVDQAAIAVFVASGGSLGIMNFQGGNWGTALGFTAPASAVGGFSSIPGRVTPGTVCFDANTVTAAGLAFDITAAPSVGCFGHQVYDMAFFGPLGYTALVLPPPGAGFPAGFATVIAVTPTGSSINNPASTGSITVDGQFGPPSGEWSEVTPLRFAVPGGTSVVYTGLDVGKDAIYLMYDVNTSTTPLGIGQTDGPVHFVAQCGGVSSFFDVFFTQGGPNTLFGPNPATSAGGTGDTVQVFVNGEHTPRPLGDRCNPVIRGEPCIKGAVDHNTTSPNFPGLAHNLFELEVCLLETTETPSGSSGGVYSPEPAFWSAAVAGTVVSVSTVDISSGGLTTVTPLLPLALNVPPVARCQNVTVSAGPTCTANASINNGSFDPDGGPITLVQSPPGPYSLGPTLVTLTVRDILGAAASCTATVTVVDTTKPVVSSSVAETRLWPPNHELVNVGLTVLATDNCAASPTIQVRVFSNEDDEADTGDGNFSPDAANIAPKTLRLRQERNGDGNGRVYLNVATAKDAAGNVGASCSTVVVPHSQSRADINAADAAAAAARAFCTANNGAPPQGYFVIGDGPVIGPKQ